MAYFKQRTEGHFVIMGRKTYESLPKQLKNRRIIVLTTQQNYDPKDENVIVRNTVGEIIHYLHYWNADHVYICGGGKVYEQFVGYADYILLTRVDIEIENPDAHFPLIQLGNWHLATSRPQSDLSSKYTYYFETYKRA